MKRTAFGGRYSRHDMAESSRLRPAAVWEGSAPRMSVARLPGRFLPALAPRPQGNSASPWPRTERALHIGPANVPALLGPSPCGQGTASRCRQPGTAYDHGPAKNCGRCRSPVSSIGSCRGGHRPPGLLCLVAAQPGMPAGAQHIDESLDRTAPVRRVPRSRA